MSKRPHLLQSCRQRRRKPSRNRKPLPQGLRFRSNPQHRLQKWQAPPMQAVPPGLMPPVTQLQPESKPKPAPERTPPPPPPGPKPGDKVGFIQLRPRPSARFAEKPLVPNCRLGRGMPKRRILFAGVTSALFAVARRAPAGPAMPGARLQAQAKGGAATKSAESVARRRKSCCLRMHR